MPVDYSPAAVTARLREAARLFAETPWDSPRIDMSPAALTRRLNEVSALVELYRRLGAGRSEAPPSDK
jgi:hypothetical protein